MRSREADFAAPPAPETLVDLTSLNCPLRWEEIFPQPGPVEMEIGSGKGRFVIEASRRWPDHNFLGVELAGRYLRIAVERAAKRGLRNVRLVRTDARDLLTRWLPPASLHRIHIYFPDPWPKKRHHKRRLVSGDFPAWAERVLVPSGEILLATDHQGYLEWILDIMGAAPRFERRPWDPLAENWILTNYAVKWASQGRALHWLRYALAAPPGPAI